MLRRAGYHVVDPEERRATLDFLTAEKERVDLFVTSLQPAAPNAYDVMVAARQARPGLPILAMVGYDDESASIPDELAGTMVIAAKPLGAEDLLERVHAILSAQPSRQGR